MFPPASSLSATTRKRGVAELDPPVHGAVKKPAGMSAVPPQDHISRLQDLSPELHSACLAYMPPADIVRYVGALPAPMSQLAERAAAALGLRIQGARNLDELRRLAARLVAVDPAFRHRAIQQMHAVLRQAARRLPMESVVVLRELLQHCRQACDGLVAWRAMRLQQACLDIELLVGMRHARSPEALLAQLLQVPQLPPSAQGSALSNALRALERMVRGTAVAGRPIGALEPVLIEIARLSAGLPAPGRAEVLRSAFTTLAEADSRLDQPLWTAARESLSQQVAGLPAAQIHRAVPTEEDQFVEVVADLLGRHPPAARIAFYDDLLQGVPDAGDARVDALAEMATVLAELPDTAMLSRLERICRETVALDPDLSLRDIPIQALASEPVFAALPPADVPEAFGMLLDAVDRGAFDPFARKMLYTLLEACIAHAPPAEQAALRARWQQAREPHPPRHSRH